jgi:hypothetical protein
MYKNQKSVRAGIEDFLCPFTDMYITQGSGGSFSHAGTMANDVRGRESGIRYLIYAPCDMVCKKIYPSTGQAMFQSKRKVRFANGRIDYATFMVAHDNTMDSWVGREFSQGDGFFQMGDKGYATGVHTHFEVSQSRSERWYQNEYGIWNFDNEYDINECCFIDNTNVIDGNGLTFVDTSILKKDTKKQYITLGEMYIRWGAGTNYPIKLVENMSEDGKKHATSTNPKAYAVYKKDTIFDSLELINKNDGSIWSKTYSGYICIKGASGTIYCSEV